MKLVILLICLAGMIAIVPFFRLFTNISKRRNQLTGDDVADFIERHIQGTEGKWDWDEFTSIPIANDGLDRIRERCSELDGPLPISQETEQELRNIVERLRGGRE
jgi:hypothetical protein